MSEGKYQVHKWVDCPHCSGSGCMKCWDGKLQVDVDLLGALQKLGIIDQLASQETTITKLNNEMLVMAREMLRMQETIDDLRTRVNRVVLHA